MINKLTDLFVGTAHAQGRNLFDFFDGINIFRGSGTNLNAEGTATNLITLIVNWMLGIAAVIAFIYLVMSGINYITAGGDADKATKARTGILNAIIGIVVIVLAFFIMRFAAGLGGSISGS